MPAPLPIRTDRNAAELRRLARRERDGRVSARLLALANALEGLPREEAARLAGMTGQTLGDWVHRYNVEGGEGLRDRHRSGRPCTLDESRQAALKALVLKGPRLERDGCIAWRARDLCGLVERRFGVRYSETGMLRLLKGVDLSWQKARPIHPEADPKAQERFKKTCPGLIAAVAREHPGERVEPWFMDEARIGQKGHLTHVWSQQGARPRGVQQQGFASAHLFGAVCPERDAGVALAMPEVSTAAMGLFLAELSRSLPPGTHAALVLDGAGWHISPDLEVPANLTLIRLPPYSPELNPVERVWEYLRDRWLSHRILAGGYEAVRDAACTAWNALLAEPGRLRSLTSFPWLPTSVTTS
jgi:transposase